MDVSTNTYILQKKPNNPCTYLRGRIKAGTHGLSAVEGAYGRLWSMADRTWQIEHRGEFRLALRRATSLPRGNKRDYVSYKTLVRWRFACALRGSARGFWFIDPLGLRPRGLRMYRRHSRMPRKPRAAIVQL